MTTRNLNYTGCERIRRSDVQIEVDDTKQPPQFSYAFALEEYDFPADAEVVVEAFVHWTTMRFVCGTIAHRSAERFTLDEFTSIESLQFRVKVVGTADRAGLILGEADHIRPATIQGRDDGTSFLPVQPIELGDVVWRLSFEGPSPLLLVNARLGDWRSFLRRPEVRALVLPEVFRQLLSEALTNEGEAENSTSWQAAVLQVVHPAAGPRPSPDDDDMVEAWLDAATQRFARTHRLFAGVSGWSTEEA